ncbi:hypothetical protein GGI11_008734, partial [Coemansia sp. RSA 2049]
KHQEQRSWIRRQSCVNRGAAAATPPRRRGQCGVSAQRAVPLLQRQGASRAAGAGSVDAAGMQDRGDQGNPVVIAV